MTVRRKIDHCDDRLEDIPLLSLFYIIKYLTVLALLSDSSMSATSGIPVSPGLYSAFADAVDSKSIRFIKVSIKNGTLSNPHPLSYL